MAKRIRSSFRQQVHMIFSFVDVIFADISRFTQILLIVFTVLVAPHNSS